MTVDNLAKLKITSTGFIDLKPNSEECITGTASLGQSELWSSVNLHCHIHLLENHITRNVCNNLSIFVLFTYPFRPQARVCGLMHSCSVHLQCYHQISAWFSTWNVLFQPLLSARQVCQPFLDL